MKPAKAKTIFEKLPSSEILVVGDYFLDRYLDIDSALDEPSLETGLTAYQVVGIRSSPGAAGTVANNLVALGVGKVIALGIAGEDGHGLELRQAMEEGGIDASKMIWDAGRVTPTYTKPMREEAGRLRELNRLDFQNRTPVLVDLETELIRRLWGLAKTVDGIHVMDQVEMEGCGVITPRVRKELASIAEQFPHLPITVDSRAYIQHFQQLSVKINVQEAAQAAGMHKKNSGKETAAQAGTVLAGRHKHPVYITMAEQGILVVEPSTEPGIKGNITHIPAVPVVGPIDPVGAGDSVSAGVISALAVGAGPVEAAVIGNVVASITIQQLGTTGTASPTKVVERLHEVDIGVRIL